MSFRGAAEKTPALAKAPMRKGICIDKGIGHAPRVGFIGEGVFGARERDSNASPMPISFCSFLVRHKKGTESTFFTGLRICTIGTRQVQGMIIY